MIMPTPRHSVPAAGVVAIGGEDMGGTRGHEPTYLAVTPRHQNPGLGMRVVDEAIATLAGQPRDGVPGEAQKPWSTRVRR